MLKKLAPALALILALPTSAFALNTNDLLSLVAMPLAVAAVSNVTGVPRQDLTNIVSALNKGNVAPTQFVEVVRYTPAVLTNQNTAPQFVDYVNTQVSQGVTGDALATAIADRLRGYGVQDINVASPPQIVYVDDQSLLPATVLSPSVSYSPSTLGTNDLLSLVAMPLAVDAVANLTGVPTQDLMNLITQLNQANVPPPQFIEVVRYVPVVLVDQNTAPQFVDYVNTQVNQGVTGNALANAIANQLRTYGASQINVTAPPQQIIVEQRNFVPPVVMTRLEEVRQHPHGGPPGQLKKIVGVQTGAEIVHGEKRGRQFPPPMTSAQPESVGKEKNKGEGHGRGNAEQQRQVVAPPAAAPAPVEVQQQPDRGKGNDQGGPPGQAKDKEKGKGKGKDKGKGN
ncbi:MAG TPA: hypothetical protein VIO12_02090 [Thermoanaerobaculia bacterium]